MKIDQVLVESTGATVAFAFGRFNPAHQGHIEVWRAVEDSGANWFIGTNPNTLGPNDPLTFQQKSAWMEEIYPPIAGHIIPEQSVLTLAAYIFKKVRKNANATVAYITDAQDWAWSGKLLNQYNGVEGAHGYYKFAEIIHVPSPRVSSATALRDAARADDRVAFYHASGTDPKAKINGLTYFDTVKQACEKYPLPVKKAKKVKEQDVMEARSNPERNIKYGSGKYELIGFAEDIRDKDNWAVSMTMEPKLGINPQAAVSEDTPKGIYFYPLQYFMKMADRDESLPWGDDFPYMQLFQYDRSGEMTQQTKVDPAKLKQALSQYCSDEIMQQAAEEDEYDGTPYWYIYDCLSRLGKGDETNVVRWNKVLRDLGFTSVFDPGRGWIAHNEPTQGVILDPRVIKAHKMFDNRNPTMQHRRYDVQGLADSIRWSSYFQRESQLQKVYNHPDEKKVRLEVAKSMLKPFLGKSGEEAKEMGYDQALKAAADKVIEILKQGVAEGLNEFAMGGGDDDEDDKYTPQDFGKPFKANYLGQNKFEVFCRKPQDPSNVIKLNAEVQKYGLEWEENFGFWFLDSPGAVYLSWKYGEIPLPKAIDQARNPGHIHDLVTDYLTNSPHAAEIQKIATEYFGFTMDGDMNEGLDEHIVKVKGGWELKSKHGDKNLGKYPTRAGAEKREREVQYFKHMGEAEQKTVAKTWDQMTPKEKISGVKGRTVWNEKTKKYYTVFDVPAKQEEVDEASLATMRDYFAGDENARDPYEITKQRLHFSKDKNKQPTMDKRFHSPEEYEQWLAQNKLKPISHSKGWELINKRK